MHDSSNPHSMCEPQPCQHAQNVAKARWVSQIDNGKRQLRTDILSARASMPAAERSAADTRLRHALETMVNRLPTERPTVAAYQPIAAEPGGAAMVATLAAAVGQGRLLLPVLRDDLDLDWADYRGPGMMAPARMGLLEPVGQRLGRSAIAAADLVIAPAVAVDTFGTRLGRGGGSYDRALARLSGGTVVVVPLYRGEYLSRLPVEPHDRPVDLALVCTARDSVLHHLTGRRPPS